MSELSLKLIATRLNLLRFYVLILFGYICTVRTIVTGKALTKSENQRLFKRPRINHYHCFQGIRFDRPQWKAQAEGARA